jgi:hypothetical protein
MSYKVRKTKNQKLRYQIKQIEKIRSKLKKHQNLRIAAKIVTKKEEEEQKILRRKQVNLRAK